MHFAHFSEYCKTEMIDLRLKLFLVTDSLLRSSRKLFRSVNFLSENCFWSWSPKHTESGSPLALRQGISALLARERERLRKRRNGGGQGNVSSASTIERKKGGGGQGKYTTISMLQ